MTMHEGLVDQALRFKKRIASEDTSQYKVVRRGQLVVGFPIDEGVLDFQTLHDEAIVSPAYGVWDLSSSDVEPTFLKMFLRSEGALAFYRSRLRSTTARRRSLTSEAFLSLAVPLPSLYEQRRIADILDRATSILELGRTAVGGVDRLMDERFRSEFGDHPASVALGDVAAFYGGSSLPSGEPWSNQLGGYLLMKVSDMNSVGNEMAVMKTANWSPTGGSRASTAPAGTIVLPKRGASIATNKKRLLVRPAILDPNLMGVFPAPEALTAGFLFAWFRQFDLTSITSGSSVPQLNKQDLAPLLVPVPPLRDQQRFDEFSRRAASLRSVLAGRVMRLKAWESDLSARAFLGGL